jgi:ribose 5-phosphate isomerase B
VASDHGGYALKQALAARLLEAGFSVLDFGDRNPDPADDYPDFVVPLARAVATGGAERGLAICTSGVGACVAANKVAGVRACLIQDLFSARQGVEDDDLNLLCLGGRTNEKVAWELVRAFLAARFSQAARHLRRLAKVMSLETQAGQPAPRHQLSRQPL